MEPQIKFNRLFVGGEWRAPESAETIDVISPFTEGVVARVPNASRADVDTAVSAAREAFDTGPWPRMAPVERIAIMRRLYERLEANREAIAQALTREMGSPIRYSRTQQIDAPLRMLEAQMALTANYPFRSIRPSPNGRALVIRKPKGVVAAIVPWNVPIGTTMGKLGPALLMGCCVILKPAPETPLSAYVLAEAIEQAGVPKGVVSILPAGREVSEYLALHPGVDKVSFTGSTNAGMHLAEKCGGLLRPITLELGGKSAAIFLDDANIDASVEALRFGSFRNSGQVCSLKTRLIAPRSRQDQILEALTSLVESMPVGDPSDPATQIGPMVSERQQKRVLGYIDAGIHEGAKVIAGGPGRPAGLNHGWFVRPTVFANVDPNAVVAREEIFGPVLSVIAYDTEEEAVALANNSAFGLSGAVFSRNVDKALSIAERIESGTVELNGAGIGSNAPFGGIKHSGLGREQGPEGLDPYTEIMSIGLPSDYSENSLATV